jgi:hypothetical protein
VFLCTGDQVKEDRQLVESFGGLPRLREGGLRANPWQGVSGLRNVVGKPRRGRPLASGIKKAMLSHLDIRPLRKSNAAGCHPVKWIGQGA